MPPAVAETGAGGKAVGVRRDRESTLSITADLSGSSICDHAETTTMICAALPVSMFWITSAWSSEAVCGWPASLAIRR